MIEKKIADLIYRHVYNPKDTRYGIEGVEMAALAIAKLVVAKMPKPRNERTSAKVAKIAGRVMGIDTPLMHKVLVCSRKGDEWFRWSDIRALAASALTQSPPRSKHAGWPKPKAKAHAPVARKIALRGKVRGKEYPA